MDARHRRERDHQRLRAMWAQIAELRQQAAELTVEARQSHARLRESRALLEEARLVQRASGRRHVLDD